MKQWQRLAYVLAGSAVCTFGIALFCISVLVFSGVCAPSALTAPGALCALLFGCFLVFAQILEDKL